MCFVFFSFFFFFFWGGMCFLFMFCFDCLFVCYCLFRCYLISFLFRIACASSIGNVLFNDALNTFYLRLYGVKHMVKDVSDSERGNTLPPLHGLLFPISIKVFLYASSERQDNTYHGLCYTSRGALAGTRNSETDKAGESPRGRKGEE